MEVKALAAKLDDLSSISEIHIVRESTPTSCPLISNMCCGTQMPIHKINKCNIFLNIRKYKRKCTNKLKCFKVIQN